MSSLLNGTAKIELTSKLPKGITRKQAIAMLHDHSHFLSCAPNMSSFDMVETKKAPQLPKAVQALRPTETFTVTDVVTAIPSKIWDSNVISTYEFTDTNEGVFVRIKSPLSVVMDTTWFLRGEDGDLDLVEGVNLSCSRLLMSIVKSQMESGWCKISTKMCEGLLNGVGS